QTYQDAIDRAPKQDSLYRGLSLAQLGGKHTDAAIAALSKGIDQNPDSQQLRLDLALLYTSLGRVDDAVNTYEQAI
ncbi:tetratricopeptide repeat protein, partial [Acinetobacter baumannii]